MVVIAGDASQGANTAKAGPSSLKGITENYQFTPTANGTPEKVAIASGGTNGATSHEIGIYTDNAGAPGTLLYKGSDAAKWAASSWTAEVALTAVGTPGPLKTTSKYWLVILGLGGSQNVAVHEELGNTSKSTAELATLPETFGAVGSAGTKGPAQFQINGAEEGVTEVAAEVMLV